MGKNLRSIVSLILAISLLTIQAAAQYAAIGSVHVSALRLRKEPGTNAAVLATLPKGTSVEILQQEPIENESGVWFPVNYGTLTGYMSAEFLTITGADQPAEAAAEKQYGKAATRINFRSAASLQASVLQVLPKGTTVEIIATEEGWHTAVYNGKTGYVSAEFITAAAAATTAVAATLNYNGSSTEGDRQIMSQVMANTTPTDKQAKLLDIASTLLGAPYVYGASGASAFDCSGFTSYVFKQAGVSLQRTALNQYRLNGTAVNDASDLQPGDLVFFRDTAVSKNAVSHVGLYIGQGLFIHAGSGNTGAGKCVKVSDLTNGYYSRVYLCGKRVL